jgi:hypothetical protein
MRGCKAYGGQPIQAGAIIYRQLGTKVDSASLPQHPPLLKQLIWDHVTSSLSKQLAVSSMHAC